MEPHKQVAVALLPKGSVKYHNASFGAAQNK
jgi:hypothetical protein